MIFLEIKTKFIKLISEFVNFDVSFLQLLSLNNKILIKYINGNPILIISMLELIKLTLSIFNSIMKSYFYLSWISI